jgi:hypothetical protein
MNHETDQDQNDHDVKPRWEINYDAIYASQENVIEEDVEISIKPDDQEDDSPISALPVEDPDIKPRWEINYDALYESQDDHADATNDHIITKSSDASHDEQLSSDGNETFHEIKENSMEDTSDYLPFRLII